MANITSLSNHGEAMKRDAEEPASRAMALKPLIFMLFLCLGRMASAATVEIGPTGDLRAAIAALRPGDELQLAGGTYTLNSRFNISVAGTAAQPIVIRAKTGQTPVIFMNTGNQNVIEIESSSYLVIRGIGFRGGSDGIRLISSGHITIEDCEIHDIGNVGISANSGGTYDALILRRNHIHHTSSSGEGMYLGCNNNGCRVSNSLIEGNHVHHTNGPDVDQGDGIELKEGSFGNIIRDNVVHDTNYPGILTYSTVGNGPANIIEGNVIWHTNDFAIQSAADAIIRNNIVLNGTIGMQPHQAGSPSNLTLVHNTIVGTGNGIEVRGVSGSVVIANNAVYSQSGTAISLISGNTGLVTLAGNVVTGGVSGASSGFINGRSLAQDFVNANFTAMLPINVFPAAGSALAGAGSAAHVTDHDFNGVQRSGAADAGAYRYSAAGNPGWTVAEDFKGSVTKRPNPPTNLQVQP